MIRLARVMTTPVGPARPGPPEPATLSAAYERCRQLHARAHPFLKARV